jgi:hypothetical protein
MTHVPRPKSDNDTSINFRLPGNWLDEAEELIEALSPPGVAYTRMDILRLALRRGLNEFKRKAAKKGR